MFYAPYGLKEYRCKVSTIYLYYYKSYYKLQETSEVLCVLVLFQCLFLDQISFEKKQNSRYKVNFNFIFISIEKFFFGNILNCFRENPGTNQNLYR